MSEEINKLLKDVNGQIPSKQKVVKSKVTITTPYEIDSSEFSNFMDSLGEMNRDNSFEYIITRCKRCDNCGALNDTVEPCKIPVSYKRVKGKVVVKETQKVMLCDYCVRDFK